MSGPSSDAGRVALFTYGFRPFFLAVSARAALGHTGRPLEAPPAMASAYALLILAVLVRVFGPILLRPRVDGKPG